MRNFAFEGERSLRISKIRQSVSKYFRKFESMKHFASISTILETAKKNGIDHSTIIRAVLNGTDRLLLANALA